MNVKKNIYSSEKDKHFEAEKEQIGEDSDGALPNGGCFIYDTEIKT